MARFKLYNCTALHSFFLLPGLPRALVFGLTLCKLSIDSYTCRLHPTPNRPDLRPDCLSGVIFITRMNCAYLTVLLPKARTRRSTTDESVEASNASARMIAWFAAEHGAPKVVMIDTTYLKAHRIATSIVAQNAGAVV